MYSSLHKLDIVGKDKAGRDVVMQTDHRSVDEVERDKEISVIFALTRLLASKRTDHKHAVVRYVTIHPLHPDLAVVAVATGAEAEAEGKAVDLTGTRKALAADLADAAFAGLGKKVLAREELPATEAGLVAFEQRIDREVGDPEDAEIRHWTTVVELAAVAGEVVRALHGGRWVDDDEGYSTVPFMFRIGSSGTDCINVVGKVERFMKHGHDQAPHHLLRAIAERDEPEGALLLSFKPSSWAGADMAVCERLPLVNGDKVDADLPLVTYGHDRPTTFGILKKDAAPHPPIEELRRQALANLAGVEVQVQKVELEGLTFHVVHSSYFACEKLLDEAFLKRMHAEIGATLMAAAVPEKGRLFLTDAVTGGDAIVGFLAIARGVFEKNEGGRQISPTVFLVSDGTLVGVATTGSRESFPEKTKKKGFFSRIFGGD